MDRLAVLVVDDEESVRTYLAEFLGSSGYQVRVAASGEQALSMLEGGSFDAVLLDVLMPNVSGLEVLKRYRAQGGTAPVIVLSALSGADDAVRAMKVGATDYLPKPFGNDELVDVLARALGRKVEAPTVIVPARTAPAAPGRALDGFGAGSAAEGRYEDLQIISVSPAMRKVHAMVQRIADADVPVLLLGESGTGKEVVARDIHQQSRRRARPFIKVNCAALPAELLESELFGHEKGAFTGATGEKPGKFELADQGSIFLDEIGEMAIRLQAKLLQVLQDEEFFRVGGKRSVRVDSRVVVATNRDLEKEIAAQNFREDLFYRLNVVAIRLPPLRERKEDILPLVEHFLRKYGRKYKQGSELPFDMPDEVLRAFVAHDWPGNVRELENMVRRLVVLKDPHLVLDELREGKQLVAEQALAVQAPALPAREPSAAQPTPPAVEERNRVAAPAQYLNPFQIPQPPPPPPRMPESEMSLKDIGKRAAMLAEREAILAMLQRTAWNKRKAATKLRISYKALLYKIKETGIIDPRANAEF